MAASLASGSIRSTMRAALTEPQIEAVAAYVSYLE
jgi:hypothetical protein